MGPGHALAISAKMSASRRRRGDLPKTPSPSMGPVVSLSNHQPGGTFGAKRLRVRGASRVSVAIQVSGLTKVYAHRPALRGLDLELPWGKLLTVFGPNGSGKTTLLRLRAGLARPPQGRV